MQPACVQGVRARVPVSREFRRARRLHTHVGTLSALFRPSTSPQISLS